MALVVYREGGKKVSLKKLKEDYNRVVLQDAPKRPKKGSRTHEKYDFDTWLMELKNSPRKADKVVALIWKEKGYRFDNYEQWRTQMIVDSVYARKLVGYSGEQILEAIERCREEGQKVGYEWKASTVCKKIAEVTV
jgi:hypothetical protein